MKPTSLSRVSKNRHPSKKRINDEFNSDADSTQQSRRALRHATCSGEKGAESPDSDRDLIYAFPSAAQQRSRRELLAAENKNGCHHLAFTSLDNSIRDNNEDDDEDEHLHAGMSSAAACITLEIPIMPSFRGGRSDKNPSVAESIPSSKRLTRSNRNSTIVSAREIESWRSMSSQTCHRFKPVFTHQFFSDEKVRGYRPTDEALEEAQSVAHEINDSISEVKFAGEGLHASFIHHGAARYSLSIQVRLSPSCKTCCLVLKVDKIQQTIEERDGGRGRPLRRAATAAACALRQLTNNASEESDDFTSSDEDERELDNDSDDDNFKLKNQYRGKRRRCTIAQTPRKRSCGQTSEQQRPVRRCVRLRQSKMALHSKNVPDEAEDSSTSSTLEVENENQSPLVNSLRRSSRNCGKIQQSKQSLYTVNESADEASLSELESIETKPCRRINTRKQNDQANFIRRRSTQRTRLQPAKRSLYSIDELWDTGSLNVAQRSSRRLVQLQLDRNDQSESESCTSTVDSEIFSQATSSLDSSRFKDDGYSTETPKGTRRQFQRSTSAQSSVASSHSNESSLAVGRMKIEAIVNHISPGLPEVAAVVLLDENSCSFSSVDGKVKAMSATVKTIEDIDNNYLYRPIGKVLQEYTRKKPEMNLLRSGGIKSSASMKDNSNSVPPGSNGEFVLTLADMRIDQEARVYHDQVEKLAPWFIEVADCVDMGSTRGIRRDGFWKVLYLFEKYHIDDNGEIQKCHRRLRSSSFYLYQLAGYMTLFHSTEGSQGTRMIVCQALLLPPYQKNGHGQEMMRAAYDIAHGVCGAHIQVSKPFETIVEIDVESPALAFVALRNRIDYDLIRSVIESYQNYPLIPHQFTKCLQLDPGSETFDPTFFIPLPDHVISKVASTLKVVPRQVQIAYEIWKLVELEKFIKDSVSSSLSTAKVNRMIVSMETSYKSMVKTSLLQFIRDNQSESKFEHIGREEQKKQLEKLFRKNLSLYRSIIGRS